MQYPLCGNACSSSNTGIGDLNELWLGDLNELWLGDLNELWLGDLNELWLGDLNELWVFYLGSLVFLLPKNSKLFLNSVRFEHTRLMVLCYQISMCLLNIKCICFHDNAMYTIVFILCLMCPMVPVSLDCPFLIAPSVFSNVYFHPAGVTSVSGLSILDCTFGFL